MSDINFYCVNPSELWPVPSDEHGRKDLVVIKSEYDRITAELAAAKAENERLRKFITYEANNIDVCDMESEERLSRFCKALSGEGE